MMGNGTITQKRIRYHGLRIYNSYMNWTVSSVIVPTTFICVLIIAVGEYVVEKF